MFDRYNRQINYLRISVTDRCNLRCEYCMPATGVKLLGHNEILSFEEIIGVVKAAVGLGVTKVRITGGEPLVRKEIITLIKMIGSFKEITDFGMTTNGIFLDKYASQLKEAGLHRVNISLDSIDPDKFRLITRGGDIEKVFQGIEAAKKAGLTPIKVNVVIRENKDEPDAVGVRGFCEENDLQIRYIHMMELDKGEFSVVEGGDGGDCAICNRLRLTANGKIKPCLFSEIEYDVRELGPEGAILKAVENKPACGTVNTVGQFYNIGG